MIFHKPSTKLSDQYNFSLFYTNYEQNQPGLVLTCDASYFQTYKTMRTANDCTKGLCTRRLNLKREGETKTPPSPPQFRCSCFKMTKLIQDEKKLNRFRRGMTFSKIDFTGLSFPTSG